MSDTHSIALSTFTLFPAGRYRKDGPYTAEQWRDDHLIPALNHALETGNFLTVDLCATRGVCASFLEEVFGGLLRKTKTDHRANLRIVSKDLDVLEKAHRYMDEEFKRWDKNEEAPNA